MLRVTVDCNAKQELSSSTIHHLTFQSIIMLTKGDKKSKLRTQGMSELSTFYSNLIIAIQKHPFCTHELDNIKNSYKSNFTYINPKSQSIIKLKPINSSNIDKHTTQHTENGERTRKPTYCYHQSVPFWWSICSLLCPLPQNFDCWTTQQFYQTPSALFCLQREIQTRFRDSIVVGSIQRWRL